VFNKKGHANDVFINHFGKPRSPNRLVSKQPLLALMSILSQSFFTLVRGHLVAFFLFPAWHSLNFNSVYDNVCILLYSVLMDSLLSRIGAVHDCSAQKKY